MEKRDMQQPQPDLKEEKPSFAQKQFHDLASAMQFIKDFWMHVEPERVGERVAELNTEKELREHTALDRTVLNGTTVTIYRNADKQPLTDKAIEFLKLMGVL